MHSTEDGTQGLIYAKQALYHQLLLYKLVDVKIL